MLPAQSAAQRKHSNTAPFMGDAAQIPAHHNQSAGYTPDRPLITK